MEQGLLPGLTGERAVAVQEENTAMAYGSGLVPVFATPAMVGLMEGAAVAAVEGVLEPGQGTVGTALQIQHLAATPIGMTVRAEAKLTEVDGRRLVFAVKAWDDQELIGQGTHERFIIRTDSFLAKAEKKRLPQGLSE